MSNIHSHRAMLLQAHHKPAEKEFSLPWDELGSYLGITGCLLMSFNVSMFWGFAMFFISNISWLVYGFKKKTKSLIRMQSVFLLSSIIGLYTWY